MYSSWDKIPPRGDKKFSDKELWISINYIQNNMKKVFLEIRKHNLRNMKNSVLPIIQFDLLWKSRGRILLLCVSQVIFLTSGKWRVACLSFVAIHHTAPKQTLFSSFKLLKAYKQAPWRLRPWFDTCGKNIGFMGFLAKCWMEWVISLRLLRLLEHLGAKNVV